MRKFLIVSTLIAAALPLAAQPPAPPHTAPTSAAPLAPTAQVNPFFVTWTTPFAVPPFERIKPEHYRPAFEKAIAERRAEVDAIAANPVPPTFANTVEALEQGGELLERVSNVFSGLSAADTNDAMQAIEKDIAPQLAALRDDIALNRALFARVKAVWAQRETLTLDQESRKLLEETYKSFVRGGANLQAEQQARFREINRELSLLSVKFGDNLLAETNAFTLVVERQEDLAGIPTNAVAAAAEAARAAGMAGKWLFTLQPSSFRPVVTYADTRDLRRRLWTAYRTRADHGDARDNNQVAARIAALRAERAKLLGYRTHADYVLEETMAKKPDAVFALMKQLWVPAVARVDADAKELLALADPEGKGFQLEPWDWGYYSEKVKRAKYDLDEEALRPYFSFDRVREGVFHVANRLYGITVIERTDIPKYSPDVRTFEVKDRDGSFLGVFMTDYTPRPGKRAGAWSGRYRSARVRDGHEIRPIVVNVGSFTRPAAGKPALLSRGEVRTLFHEFGHALNSLFSRVRYARLQSLPRDFGELPSQIMEHWAMQPEVLKVYARHFETNEPLSAELIARMQRADTFNQGAGTVAMVATSLLDMDWHTLADAKEIDASAFEKASFERMGLPRPIASVHRTPAYYHVFNGGYAAGYYGYLWCEVLDADAFEAFKEKGIFDQATAASFRANILERPGTGELMDAWVRFRGRAPQVEPLLRKRGLLAGAGSSPAGT